ncbi:MAG: class I SAM-dependent methyltransferase [Acidobacteria bacterium]|nr:class I SAM-dependent methyltransferase [Acidobacteriota bacterium]
MSDYQTKLARESRKWGNHLRVEASGEWHSWLDHPVIRAHYQERALIDGATWEAWIIAQLDGPAARSLDLGCGAGEKSLTVFRANATARIEGMDISEERIQEGEKRRQEANAAGGFRVADVNSVALEPNSYDLIFSCHSFHHFLNLEHIMAQVNSALTPRGFFVLEEFVGPTQFQWTDEQIATVRSTLGFAPEHLKRLRWDAIKEFEGRPTPAEVEAVSPFEAIRSAEIFPLFRRYFDVEVVRGLGGTIQHLLYNGIIHNFADEEGAQFIETVCNLEDTLIDMEMLPSDFMLLIGRKKNFVSAAEEQEVSVKRMLEREREVKLLRLQLKEKQVEIDNIKNSPGWRLLSRYGRLKYRYLLPVYKMLGLRSDRKKPPDR